MDTRTLDIRTATRLATVIGWAQRGARVTWRSAPGRLTEGVVRSIGDEMGGFALDTEDVRDCHLRISSTFEWFLPMADVLDLLDQGLIAEI